MVDLSLANGLDVIARARVSSNGGASGASLSLWLACTPMYTLSPIPLPTHCDWLWWVCSEKYTNPSIYNLLYTGKTRSFVIWHWSVLISRLVVSFKSLSPVTWIINLNLMDFTFSSTALFQKSPLSGRMATGNPTTEAQQAYDNFWPKVTDGNLWIKVPSFF